MDKIIGIAVLIIFSAYFSATETAFTSVNRIRIKNLANDGNKKARDVLMKAPSKVSAEQLKDVHIKLDLKEE